MRVPSRPRSRGLRFNITPMIDVVFLLVIFFLVTAHFVQNQEVDAVELPVATQTQDVEELPRRLAITVLADGTMRAGGKDIHPDSLDLLLEQTIGDDPAGFEVRIRADRSVPYAAVEPILLSCARHGIRDVGVKVIEGTQPAGRSE
jgi:biopolymer transport protein ExbD